MFTAKLPSLLTLAGVGFFSALPIAFLSVAASAQTDASDTVGMGTSAMPMGTTSMAPDDSGVNRRDASGQTMTADQGGNAISDRDIMQKIRKAVVADRSLSTYAHNIKIIAKNGTVTLKGPVTSNQEKQSIEAKAVSVVGNDNVRDKLSVTTSN